MNGYLSSWFLTQIDTVWSSCTAFIELWLTLRKKWSSSDMFHEISFSSIVPEWNESLILELSNEFETKSMYYHTDFHLIKTFIKEFVNGFKNLKIDRKLRNIAYVSFFWIFIFSYFLTVVNSTKSAEFVSERSKLCFLQYLNKNARR